MLPKEHGAYGQLGFPLVTSLIVAGPAYASVLVAAAAVALFLAHEPMLVLLGYRGVRARTTDAPRAWWWLTGALVAGTATAILALDATPAGLRWTFLVPALPAAWVAYAAIHGHEKTSLGESGAAVAFAAAALPLCAGAGRADIGAAIAVAFALLFVLATLAVRVIVLRTRAGVITPPCAAPVRRPPRLPASAPWRRCSASRTASSPGSPSPPSCRASSSSPHWQRFRHRPRVFARWGGRWSLSPR